MEITPIESFSVNEWNKIITKEVEKALGSELDGKFTAANYPAGFNYVVRQINYNADTLKALNNKVVVKDDYPRLESGYTDLYKRVIEKIHYKISEKDQQHINMEENEQASLVSSIVTAYQQSGIDDKKTKYPSIKMIMDRIEDVTGKSFDEVDVEKYPYLSTLCNLLSEFTDKAVFTAKIQRSSAKAEARLKAIIKNITTPTEENGGLKTDDKYVCGWDNIKESKQYEKSLAGGNSITFTFSANNFHDKSSNLNFNNKIYADVPVDWFFHMGATNNNKYNFNNYTANGATVSVALTYNGITLVPAIPTELSADNKKGWYASDILAETAAKSGKDVTGYQLIDSAYDPKTLFGKNGTLRRMRTLVISQLPSIKLHFSNFDCLRLLKSFEEQTEVKFSIFGGLISGSHDNRYSFSEYSYDEKSQTVDVILQPKPLGSCGTAYNQTAYVLGGVIDYFDNDVEVKKIRFIADESDAEDMTVPEELKSLKLKYRKNEDGRYEFAGLYDENEDGEYQIGDTIAVPITSQYVGTWQFNKGTPVWNVIGSKGDICIGHRGSWIQLWESFTPEHNRKCYVCKDPDKCPHRCNTLVGAHLVTDPYSVRPVKGDPNHFIYIIPICNSMNNPAMRDMMTLNEQVYALRLNRFQDKY